MKSRLEVAVMGYKGRMAEKIRHAVDMNQNMNLRGYSKRQPDTRELFSTCDVVIDFTNPENSITNAFIASQTGTPIIIGTTGFSQSQEDSILRFAQKTGIVKTANTSPGANLIIDIAKQVARQLGTDYDISITETHHDKKKDTPSGTAIMIRDAIDPSIEIDSLRVGDYTGTHEVLFSGEYDSITITHAAFDRTIFADGALRAAEWIMTKPHGLYTMKDVLEN